MQDDDGEGIFGAGVAGVTGACLRLPDFEAVHARLPVSVVDCLGSLSNAVAAGRGHPCHSLSCALGSRWRAAAGTARVVIVS